ncbi:MAG: agmatinase [Candidatus Hodarchaeales archaeon]|jgi:agmatinase
MQYEIPGEFVRAAELPGFITAFNDAHLIIVGLPLEHDPTFRGGTRMGPARIREALNFIETLSPFTNRDIIDIKFHDLGDLILNAGTVSGKQSMIEKAVSGVLAREKRIGLMGGNHAILPPIFNALKKKHPDAGLVIFDAHLDLRENFTDNEHSHACVLHRILQKHPKTPILHVGSRVITRDERKTIEKISGNLQVINALDFYEKKERSTKDKINDYFDTYQGKIHLSIDMDCFDPSTAPGVGNPEFPGLSALQVFKALHCIRNEVVSFDLCEFTPSWDTNGITGILAAKTFCELMLKTETS